MDTILISDEMMNAKYKVLYTYIYSRTLLLQYNYYETVTGVVTHTLVA